VFNVLYFVRCYFFIMFCLVDFVLVNFNLSVAILFLFILGVLTILTCFKSNWNQLSLLFFIKKIFK
jgi:hypothetical protein